MATLKVPVNAGDHAEGSPDAACTLVEFGDYQCSDCGKAYAVVKELQRSFGSDLRLVFRNFPLTRIHAQAQAAAETAEFAGAEGQFWPMHDLLFEHQPRLGLELYAELAAQLGLDAAKLTEALEKQTFAERVRSDFSGGVRSGVNGTPTFFVNGERHNGPMDFEHLARKVEEAIAQAKA